MGENSVNQYLVLRVVGDGVHLGYRVDFAETPTVREMRELDSDGDGKISEAEKGAYLGSRAGEWASRITVKVNGKECGVKVGEVDLKVSEGAGGRKTLLVMVDLVADRVGWGEGVNQAEVGVGNYARVAGWREAAVLAGEGWWVVEGGKHVKAKVLDSREETGEGGRDWGVGFGFEGKGARK